MNTKHVLSTVAALAISLVAATPALAGGIHTLTLKSIPSTDTAIKVDGSLSDWPATAVASQFLPIEVGIESSASDAAKKLRANSHNAAVRACYDSVALYIAVEQRGAPGTPLPPVALSVLTDRMAHVRIAAKAGGNCDVAIGYDTTSPVPAPTASAELVMGADRKTAVDEIRIPWKLLTKAGALPTNRKVRLSVDLVWPDLTPAAVAALPLTVLHPSTFTALSFLTAPGQAINPSGYLPNPSQWGQIAFSADSKPNTVSETVTETRATVLNAAKAAAKPAIDGDLADWPAASFATAAFMPGYLGDRYSAKLATQWDGDYLYVAARVKTALPISNPQNENTKAGYWGGDCIQIRLNNGAHTANLCAWYDSVNGKAALTADGKDLTNSFLLKQSGAEAFKLDPARHEYTQEIAIPWKALGWVAPEAGQTRQATFQIWWAGLNPEYTALIDASLEEHPALAYTYTMPAEGNVTVGIFDNSGRLLRWLTRSAHRRAGKVTEYWDGLDQYGQQIPAGIYTVKAITMPPLGVEHKITVGNPGTPQWPTPEGTGDWIGDESSPQGCATDGDWVYLASPCAENGWSIIGVDGTGQRRWGFKTGIEPRCVVLSVSGSYLYALYSGPEKTDSGRFYNGHNAQGRAVLICLDKRTGKLATFSTAHPELQIGTWPYREDVHWLWDLRTNSSYSAATYAGQPRYFSKDIGETENAIGIAASPTRIYVSQFYDNKILVLDASNATKVDEIPLTQPAGLCLLPSGKLLAATGTTVASIDPATRAVTPFITTGLVAPHDITVDSRGTVYVTDWGKSFQVKAFDSTGKLLRAIGKPGGRPWVGKWDNSGMLVPRGIAVTNAGKLWVAEDDNSPSRVSVWDAATGQFVRDYLGPTAYGGAGNFWIDPKDPSTVMGSGTIYTVDYAKKTSTPRAIAMRRMSHDQPFMPNAGTGIPAGRTFERGGVQYFATSGYTGVTILRRTGDRFTPVSAVGYLPTDLTGDGAGADEWDSDIGHHVYANWAPAFFKGHAGHTYCWNDINGDGLVQADEMQWLATARRGDLPKPGVPGVWTNFWGTGLDPQGSIFFATAARESLQIFRLDAAKSTASGGPQYDLSAAKEIVTIAKPGGVNGLYATAEGKLMVTYSLEWPPTPRHTFECYDRDGKLLWGVAPFKGQEQPDDPSATNICGDFNIPGVGNILGGWNWHMNYKPYLLTSDGLYVGYVLDDTLLGPTATWGESYKYYYQGPDGQPVIINGANDAYHILNITGLDKAKRFGGTLTLTAADVAAAEAARTRSVAAPVAAIPKPIVRADWATSAPTVDGSLADWNMAAGVNLQGKGGRSAQIALKRDTTMLYLAYSVKGGKLVNKGANWQTLFISGDCVDLMLSTNPSAKAHYTPAAGDERLLISVYNGKPVAVLYQPVAPGSTNGATFATAHIDRVIQLPSARIATKTDGASYVVEAAIPLADLGIDPSQAAAVAGLRGDVGVIYADETGSNRAQRLYYYNQNTNIISDLTTEATLQPGEWGLIEEALGPNLLKNTGFEEPLTTNREQGWAVTATRNGGDAAATTEAPFSGKRSLALWQPVAPDVAISSYNMPDYRDFLNAINNGKGGGYAEVCQQVPVQPGKLYRFRVHVRTVDLAPEKKTAGAGRGYIATSAQVNWLGATDHRQDWTTAVSTKDDANNWLTMVDTRTNEFTVTHPYVAPEGATAATIVFRLVDNFPDKLPKAFYDDVELVEVW
ncbi:MAG TPA: FlgD immunoglobulin-like domain containing protein [Capsulimonadaceae bacterium]|jgi:hypothetical protein